MKYSLQERIDIIFLYGRNNGNLTATAASFAEKFPDKSKIPISTLKRLIDKFKENGDVKDLPKKGRPKSAITEDSIISCLSLVEVNPKISIRKLSQECGISHPSVSRILKKHKYFPYKMHILQELHASDKDRRLEFCEFILSQSPNFVQNVIFSDEAIFHLSGHVNRHNSRYWSDKNPYWVDEHPQTDPRVMVWCGIHDKKIIGPYFFETTVTANSYIRCLQALLIPYLDTLPLSNFRDIYFQQDGAPAHFANTVRAMLDRILPNKWIGRRGPIEWPPRSPDLTPLDFFLWGYLKSQVYTIKPRNVQELKENIAFQISLIGEDTLNEVSKNWLKRIEHCQRLNGSHIEQFY